MQNEAISQHKPEISLKDRFFRYFQHEITGGIWPHPVITVYAAFANGNMDL